MLETHLRDPPKVVIKAWTAKNAQVVRAAIARLRDSTLRYVCKAYIVCRKKKSPYLLTKTILKDHFEELWKRMQPKTQVSTLAMPEMISLDIRVIGIYK